MKRSYEADPTWLCGFFGVRVEAGLSPQQIEERQRQYGPNAFAEHKRKGIWASAVSLLARPPVFLTVFAALLPLALAWSEGVNDLAPLLIVAAAALCLALAVGRDRVAQSAHDMLAALVGGACLVRRGGARARVSAVKLVPGDILLLKAGDFVPADARLLESSGLVVDEFALTGQEELAQKSAEAYLSGEVALRDQVNMVFSGSVVTAGSAVALVTHTGMGTRLGETSGRVLSGERQRLEPCMDAPGQFATLTAIAFAATAFITSALQGEWALHRALLSALLAVAVVPRALSFLSALSLFQGIEDMAGQYGLIKARPDVAEDCASLAHPQGAGAPSAVPR